MRKQAPEPSLWSLFRNCPVSTESWRGVLDGLVATGGKGLLSGGLVRTDSIHVLSLSHYQN